VLLPFVHDAMKLSLSIAIATHSPIQEGGDGAGAQAEGLQRGEAAGLKRLWAGVECT